MKFIAALTIGTAAILGACSTSAVAQNKEDLGERREIVVADSEVIIHDGEGNTRTVRMVVDAPFPPDAPETDFCVFVPAGDEAAGAISCPGGNVRVFQFGPGHNRQFVMDGAVVDEEEIRELVEERMEALRDRLEARSEWQVEIIERYNSEEFEREMERLDARMEEFTDSFELEFDDAENLTPEERQRFNQEMARFSQQMAAFGQQMARLQSEAMADVAAEMARLAEEGIPVAPEVPEHQMHWFGNGPHHADHMNRQVIRVERDGFEQITVIEQGVDEDGNSQVTIRTTDPSSINIVRIDPDEFDED